MYQPNQPKAFEGFDTTILISQKLLRTLLTPELTESHDLLVLIFKSTLQPVLLHNQDPLAP